MDPLQLIGSLIAIVLLALVAGKLFPAPKAITPEQASDDYKRYAPDVGYEAPIMAKDGKAALIPAPDGNSLGLVTLLGDQPVCRTITAADRPMLSRINGTLKLTSHDFTHPATLLALDIEAEKQVEALVAALTPEIKEANHAA
jgi:hypothetical protein